MSKELVSSGNTIGKTLQSDVQEGGDSSLTHSILFGSASTYHELLRQGLDAATPDAKGSAPLHYAAHRGDANLMRILLDSTSSHSPLNSFDMTPLHVAASMGNLDVITLLLSTGASPQSTDSHGRRPIHYAAGANQVETVAHLVRQNPDGIHAADAYGQTPLHLALMFLRRQTTQWLLENGADPMLRDSFGRNALFFVRIATSSHLKNLFRQYRTHFHSEPRTKFLTTYVHKAVKLDDIVAVHYILEARREINKLDGLGRTPLHYAQNNFMYNMLKDSVDTQIIDNYGWKAKKLVEFRSIGRE